MQFCVIPLGGSMCTMAQSLTVNRFLKLWVRLRNTLQFKPCAAEITNQWCIKKQQQQQKQKQEGHKNVWIKRWIILTQRKAEMQEYKIIKM